MKEKKKTLLSDLIFLTITLILLLVSVLSYQRIASLNKEFGWVNHSHLIKLKLEELLSNVTEAETAQRGFLLTRDSSFLQPYHSGIILNRTISNQLDSLVSYDKQQQEKVASLTSLINERFIILSKNFDVAINNPSNLLPHFREGKKQMDKVRLSVKYLLENEDYLLAERNRRKDQTAAITPRYTLFLSLAAILVVIVAYFRMRTEKNLRYMAEDSEAAIHNFFMQVPAMVAILKGPDFRFQFINPPLQELLGKADITGKTVIESLPELEGYQYQELLNDVYSTGKSYVGKELEIPYTIKDSSEIVYVNLVLKAFDNEKGLREGIMVFCFDVSEQVRTRKKIEEIELRSRLAIKAAKMGTFDWDLKKNQMLSSSRLNEIFGFKEQNGISHEDLINCLHPNDRLARDLALEASFIDGALEYEARVVWPDKSVHWINVFGTIIHDENKKPLRMYGTVIDITRQKVIIDELKESEARFRLLADSLPQLIWIGNKDGVLYYFNKAVYDYSGLTEEECISNGWVSIVHPEDREENLRKWEFAIANGTEFNLEHRFKNLKGEYRWQLSRALPRKNDEGEIQMWVGSSTDIDEQKNFSGKLQQKIDERTFELAELNKELTLKNNIFAQAEENALIGSYSWSLLNGELEYSDNLFRLLGFEPGDFIPSFEKYQSFIHPEDLEQVIKDGKETFDTKTLVEHIHRVITKQGKIKYFRSSGKVFGEAESLSLIGTVQDVTHDTQLNEILRAQNIELERTIGELESFNYVASHDLQEPLRKIQAFTNRILEKEKQIFSEGTKDYFNRITKAALRMQNLIDALISYSKTNVSGSAVVLTDLNIFIESIKEGLQYNLEEKSAVLVHNGLPTVNIIPVQFEQLLTNIISNALKYCKKDIKPLINISATLIAGKELNDPEVNKSINYWKISIADNGIGFDQQYNKKIFELFQRLHGPAEYLGTGIGLAICSKIMRNHQGHIEAEGEPGVGATFNIYLPSTDK